MTHPFDFQWRTEGTVPFDRPRTLAERSALQRQSQQRFVRRMAATAAGTVVLMMGVWAWGWQAWWLLLLGSGWGIVGLFLTSQAGDDVTALRRLHPARARQASWQAVPESQRYWDACRASSVFLMEEDGWIMDGQVQADIEAWEARETLEQED